MHSKNQIQQTHLLMKLKRLFVDSLQNLKNPKHNVVHSNTKPSAIRRIHLIWRSCLDLDKSTLH